MTRYSPEPLSSWSRIEIDAEERGLDPPPEAGEALVREEEGRVGSWSAGFEEETVPLGFELSRPVSFGIEGEREEDDVEEEDEEEEVDGG